ncbi:MAG: hypothetical protein E6J53_03090 [Chloroflexi bacterium]|nr:MAG: hypothetical protein E6J53_03090 [Chloroflexota bacterium]
MQGPRRKITIERTFNAPVADLWELWTTKEGIESWWGPEGFTTEVRKIDLRPGGELDYNMIAVAPDQIEFMKKAGMPEATPSRVTYTEVIPLRRLAYLTLADFIPGVEPYEVMTTVDLHPGERAGQARESAGGVKDLVRGGQDAAHLARDFDVLPGFDHERRHPRARRADVDVVSGACILRRRDL